MEQRLPDESSLARERAERRHRIYQQKLNQIESEEKRGIFEEISVVERLEQDRDFYVSFVRGTTYPLYYLLKEVDVGAYDSDPQFIQKLRENLQFWKVMSLDCSFFMRVYDVRELEEQKVLQFVQEYSPNDSLEKSNRALDNKEALDEEDVFTIFVEVLCAIEYLELLGLSLGLFTPQDVQKRALRNYVLAPPVWPLTQLTVRSTTDSCPGFVPPELQGAEDPSSVRTSASDIYCLGSLLYFLLEKTYPGEE